MPVTSSSFTVDAHTQADGGRYVVEKHTDSTGREHQLLYLSPASWTDTERTNVMNQRAAALDTQLAQAEADAILGVD